MTKHRLLCYCKLMGCDSALGAIRKYAGEFMRLQGTVGAGERPHSEVTKRARRGRSCSMRPRGPEPSTHTTKK